MVVCFAIMAVNSGNVFAGKIYIWTDENGQKHFSNVPPPDKNLEDLEIRGSDSHNGSSINKPQAPSNAPKKVLDQEYNRAKRKYNRAKQCAVLAKQKAKLLGKRISLHDQWGDALMKELELGPNPPPSIVRLRRSLERQIDANDLQCEIIDRKKRELGCEEFLH